MRRKPVTILASVLFALVMASPVIAKGASDDPQPSPSEGSTTSSSSTSSSTSTTATTATTATTTSTTGPSSPSTTATTAPSSSSSTCQPAETLHESAPKDGESAVYEAGDAGTVEISRMSPTDLQIVSTKANDGWIAEITADQGPRVKVLFAKDDGTGSTAKTRFAAAMDQAGEEIHVRVTSCP